MISKIIGGLVILLLAFAGGAYYGRSSTTPVVTTVDRVITQEGETKTVYVDRIVTVTKTVQKDGTTTEVTRTEDKSKNTDKHTEVTSDTKQVTSSPGSVGAEYTVGVAYRAALDDASYIPSLNNLELLGTKRLAGPLLLNVEVAPVRKEIAVGLSIEL